MKNLKVGGDILYFCNRCQLKLAHTILAMVAQQPARVRCNTCKSERNYRAAKTQAHKIERRQRTLKSSDSIEKLYHAKLQAALMNTPKKYSLNVEAATNDLIDHPKFGRGIVLKTIPPDRMEILFPDGLKVLTCKAL